MPKNDTATPTAQLGERIPLAESGVTIRYETSRTMDRDTWAETVSVLKLAFNGAPAWSQIDVNAIDHFEWKTAPDRGEGVIELTEADQRVVGLKLQFRERFLIRGQLQWLDVGNDNALDPAYQGRGLSSLRDSRRADVAPLRPADCSIDRDTHPFSDRDYEADGSIVIANRVQVMTRPLRLSGLVRSDRRARGASRTREVVEGTRGRSASEFAGSIRVAIGALIALLRRDASPSEPRVHTEQIESFDARADGFWGAVSETFDLIQVRDRSFLNWRYCDTRSGVGLVRIATAADGQMLGFIAARETNEAVTIADLLALPGEERAAQRLLAEVVTWARGRGATKVHAWIPAHHPLRGIFGGGWLVRPLPYPFVIKERTRPMREYHFLRDPEARVHLAAGDTDHI